MDVSGAPPLYREVMIWWRRWGLDLFLVVFAACSAASVAVSGQPHRVVGAAVAGLSLLVLCARRLAPLTSGVAAFLLVALALTLSPVSTTLEFLGMVLVFVLVGIAVQGRELVVAALVGLGLLAYGTLGVPTGGGFPDFALSTAICEGLLVAGASVSSRSHQVERMRAEAALVDERERWRTQEALREERARIARELHDVVSHGLSVVVVQSQAARTAAADAGSARVRTVQHHLDAVESTAREALAEMRRMLGLLQLDTGVSEPTAADGQEPEPPSPGLGALSGLVERARRAGVPVTAALPGPATRLPAGLELAVYRIVQESLTNVVRHAPGAQTTVTVCVEPGVVDVRVSNAPGAGPLVPASHVGHGLVGMRERVQMYGGRLETGPTAAGRYEVHAVLPVGADLLSGAAS